MAITEVVSGYSARNIDMRQLVAADPGRITLPMQISSTNALSIPACSYTALRQGLSIASTPVFLWGPFFAFVMAVLAIPMMTTSSSRFGPHCPPLKLELGVNCLLSVFSLDTI